MPKTKRSNRTLRITLTRRKRDSSQRAMGPTGARRADSGGYPGPNAAGWSYGDTAAVEGETLIYVADAHKGEQKCVARAETLLTAYVELKAMTARVDGEG